MVPLQDGWRVNGAPAVGAGVAWSPGRMDELIICSVSAAVSGRSWPSSALVLIGAGPGV